MIKTGKYREGMDAINVRKMRSLGMYSFQIDRNGEVRTYVRIHPAWRRVDYLYGRKWLNAVLPEDQK